jgi:hypothetical protein
MNLQPSEIRSHIIQHISANYTETPVEYPPNPFKENKITEWVSVHIDMGEGYTVMKGQGTTTRHLGLIHFAVNVKRIQSDPRSLGTRRVYEIADAVLAAMERKRLNGSAVVTRAGRVDTSELTDKTGEISFALVTIPFFVT